MGVDWSEARESVVNHLREDFSQVDKGSCAARNGTCQNESGI